MEESISRKIPPVFYTQKRVSQVRCFPSGLTRVSALVSTIGSLHNEIQYWNGEPKDDFIEMTCSTTLPIPNSHVTSMTTLDDFEHPGCFLVGTATPNRPSPVILGKVVTELRSNDFETTNIRGEHTYEYHDKPVTCVSCNSSAKKAASTGEDHKICVWSLDGEPRKEPDRVMDDPAQGTVLGAVFTSVHELLTCNQQQQLNLWDIRTSNQEPSTIMATGFGVQHVSRSTLDNFVVSAAGYGFIDLWDLRNEAKPLVRIVEDGQIWEAAFHPVRSDCLVAACDTGKLVEFCFRSAGCDGVVAGDTAMGSDELFSASAIVKCSLPVTTVDFVPNRDVAAFGTDARSFGVISVNEYD